MFYSPKYCKLPAYSSFNELEVATKRNLFLVSGAVSMKCTKEGEKLSVVQFSAVKGIALSFGAVRYSVVMFGAMQCYTVQCSAL